MSEPSFTYEDYQKLADNLAKAELLSTLRMLAFCVTENTKWLEIRKGTTKYQFIRFDNQTHHDENYFITLNSFFGMVVGCDSKSDTLVY